LYGFYDGDEESELISLERRNRNIMCTECKLPNWKEYPGLEYDPFPVDLNLPAWFDEYDCSYEWMLCNPTEAYRDGDN